MPESAATGTKQTKTAGAGRPNADQEKAKKPLADSSGKSIQPKDDTRATADKRRPARTKASPTAKDAKKAPAKKAASKPSSKASSSAKSETQSKEFKRAKDRMDGIDPDEVKKCKTVEDLDALHLKARGYRIPGLNPPALADQSGNGTVQSTKADGSIVSYDGSEKGWEDRAKEGTSKEESRKK